MNMTRLLGAIQLLAGTGNVAVAATGVAPVGDQVYWHAALTLAQAVTYWLQRRYNRDGTPDTVAYQPPTPN